MTDAVQLAPDRSAVLRWAVLLSVATVGWNIVEGVVAVVAAAGAHSVALLGFGIDSFVETASGAVVGWRMLVELRARSADAAAQAEQIERIERRASRIAGALLLALAVYILADAGRRLVGFGDEPSRSFLGIALTAISLIVMPLLGWAKLRTARQLDSRALRADAFETVTCAWLSVTTLAGLVLNATLGWWWTDPLAALVMVPLLVREGLEAWRGETCCEHEA